MIILAIDTTCEHGSIALVNRTGVMEEVLLHAPDGFAQVIFGAIEELLNRHGLTARQLDGFACASGPGSFTGVRVSLTAAKGLAEATNRKVVALSNLRILASFGTGPLRAVSIDARRGEIYGALYDAQLRCVQNEQVAKLADWQAALPEGVEFVTSGNALAGALGRIAIGEFEKGNALDPAEADANYVRRSDAELFGKK